MDMLQIERLLDSYDEWQQLREDTWAREGEPGFDTDELGYSDDDGIRLLEALVAALRGAA